MSIKCYVKGYHFLLLINSVKRLSNLMGEEFMNITCCLVTSQSFVWSVDIFSICGELADNLTKLLKEKGFELFLLRTILLYICLGQEERILSWDERLQIALDISHGIEYLHEGVCWILCSFSSWCKMFLFILLIWKFLNRQCHPLYIVIWSLLIYY